MEPLIQQWVSRVIHWPLPLWVFAVLYVTVCVYAAFKYHDRNATASPKELVSKENQCGARKGRSPARKFLAPLTITTD